jgi:hypothetical protein
MNRPYLTLLFSYFILFACNSERTQPVYKSGEGVEIYLAKHTNPYDYSINYTAINLDTIQLQDEPLIRYNDIKKYNLQNHEAELNIPAKSINKFQPHVYGHMFVLTVDKQRIYCGFILPTLSSAIDQWVMIREPLGDEANEKKLPIHFVSQQPNQDPRSDQRIISRLNEDGKLID